MDGMEIGAVSLGVGVDFTDLYSQFGQALSIATAQGDRVGNNFSSGFRRGIAGVLLDLNSLGREVSVVGRELMQLSGVSVAAQFQQIGVGFEGLLGSGEKAKALLGEIAEIGAKTPFDTVQLSQYTRMLLAMGYEADGITSKLKVMTDTAAGLGLGTEAVGRLALVMGQIRSGGLTGNNPRQLQELGINIRDVVASSTSQRFGSQDDARKWLNSQGSEKAADILLEGLQKRFGGSAERIGSGTFSGLTQNLKESGDLAMKPTGDLLLSILQPAVGLLRGVSDAFGSMNAATGGSVGLLATIGLGTVAFQYFSGTVKTVTATATAAATSVQRLSVAAAELAAASASATAAASAESAMKRSIYNMGSFGASAPTVASAGLASTAGATGIGTTIAKSLVNALPFLVPLGVGLGIGAIGQNFAKDGNPKKRIGSDVLTSVAGGVIIGGTIGAGIGLAGGVPGALLGGAIGSGVGALGGLGKGLYDVAKNKNERDKAQADDKAATAANKLADALNKVNAKVLGGGTRAANEAGLLEAELAMRRTYRTGLA